MYQTEYFNNLNRLRFKLNENKNLIFKLNFQSIREESLVAQVLKNNGLISQIAKCKNIMNLIFNSVVIFTTTNQATQSNCVIAENYNG